MALGLGALIWIIRSQAPENQTGELANGLGSGSLVARADYYDFGEVSMAAGKVSYDYQIRNSGSDPAAIAKIYTSCMCTTAELIKGDTRRGPYGMPGHGIVPKINQTVNPGEEFLVRVIFDPAAHGPAGIGPVERVIYVEQKNGEVLELRFKAVAMP